MSSILASLLGSEDGGSPLVGLVRLTSCCWIEAILGDILSLLLSRESDPADTASLWGFVTRISFNSLSIEELNFRAGVVSTEAGGARGGGGMINATSK